MSQVEDLEERVARLELTTLQTVRILETMKHMIDTLAGFRDRVHPL